MIQPYLDSKEPLIQVGMTLLEEGGYLLKRPQITQDIMHSLSLVHSKFYSWDQNYVNNNHQVREQYMSEDEDQDEDDFGSDDQDDDFSDLG